MNVVLKVLVLAVGCSLSGAHLKMSINPLGKTIIFKENDDLNLTCKVFDADQPAHIFDLSWSLPIKEDNQSRVSKLKSHNELTIVVHKLRDSDTGQYICEATDNTNIRRQKINVIIRAERERCLRPFFACDKLCIPWNYVCDGYQDCPNGNDESFKQCGSNPCEGKFFCKDRCIPKKLCCDRTTNPNCTANYIRPCCQRLLNSILPLDIVKMDDNDGQVQYKYQNLGFYQSTVYTMISCAIAFIFMSTIMLIAVCQIRMRRSAWFLQTPRPNHHRFWFNSLAPPNNNHGNFRNADNALTLPMVNYSNPMQSHREVLDPLENFVLLTYDSNTGFEVAEEYRPKPPPYTENNIGTPPPPYASTIDISTENAVEEVSQSTEVAPQEARAVSEQQ